MLPSCPLTEHAAVVPPLAFPGSGGPGSRSASREYRRVAGGRGALRLCVCPRCGKPGACNFPYTAHGQFVHLIGGVHVAIWFHLFPNDLGTT
ncbi:hypothetical protein GUJ93_ZPchr0002g25689 [Zizania palustris]|uniref:Uncharacterized protein n=1 Tax=Zizania palustris TaxID=103762 RepID=A0A8J5S9W0_ZIZPA|nr:hypothetical protein GUJ93_ZPchr0002g25689 [Zizania palustris]